MTKAVTDLQYISLRSEGSTASVQEGHLSQRPQSHRGLDSLCHPWGPPQGPLGCFHTPALDSIPLGIISRRLCAQMVQGLNRCLYTVTRLSCIIIVLFVLKASSCGFSAREEGNRVRTGASFGEGPLLPPDRESVSPGHRALHPMHLRPTLIPKCLSPRLPASMPAKAAGWTEA